MAIVEELPTGIKEVLLQLGGIALWLQAFGIILVAWIIFQIITIYYTLRRMKEISKIEQNMSRIEGKIDKLLANKKMK